MEIDMRVFFASLFAGLIFGLLGLLWGMAIGQRDAEHLARVDRAAVFAGCDEGEVPVLILRDQARPERDLPACSGGSLLRKGKR